MYDLFQKKIIQENLKYIAALSIALFSTFALLFNIQQKIIVYVIAIYCFIDYYIFDCKLDIILHHLFVIIFFLAYVFIPLEPSELYKYANILISTEISSIFLITRQFYKHIIIDILLFFTFFYYRIYLFGSRIIFNYHFWIWVNNGIQVHSISGYFTILVCISFYLLNVYWFFLILKKTWRKIIE
jgi:hypothetical protein